MRKDLREIAGLGSPPAKFTTNSSESINAAIKRHVNYKESDWPKFNDEMKQLVISQREEIIRALSGRGQYRLCPEFLHYAVSVQEWMRMRPDQRQHIVNNFEKAILPLRSTMSTHSKSGECSTAVVSKKGECSTSNDTKNGAYSTAYSADVEECSTTDGPSTARTCVPCCKLHISAEDSGISTIPLVTLEGMWGKADKLLSAENAITPAPGDHKKARMVLSYSQLSPHLVQNKSDGQYTCDSNCQQWISSQICSHSLAAAAFNGDLSSFLQWYTECAESPNISTLAMTGLSRGRGRKGGKAKRQRTRKTLPPPDNYTLRPGLQSSLPSGGVSNTGTLVNISGGAETVYAVSTPVQLPHSSDTAPLPGSAGVAVKRGPPPLINISSTSTQSQAAKVIPSSYS